MIQQHSYVVNATDNKFCSKCSYTLTPQAYEEKANEDFKLKVMEEKHKQDMKAMRQEMNQRKTKVPTNFVVKKS
jgi:integrase/recombinase XerD